jgi:DNA phosphorothioation-dependent restriction protein DptH
MHLSGILIEHLAESLRTLMSSALMGTCVRVDYLEREDAVALTAKLSAEFPDKSALFLILDPSASPADPGVVTPERAIEIRNRKQCRLCLFVPAGLMDPAASSLVNSFSAFDLNAAMVQIAKVLLDRMPREIKTAVRHVLTVLRGSSRPPTEFWADFLSSVLEKPTFEQAGLQLWRVGLIPDAGGEDFVPRLPNNRHCVTALCRPGRAQSTSAERIDGLGLQPGAVKAELDVYLSDKRLRDMRSWLRPLADEPHRGRITFDRWSFLSQGASNLVTIDVNPFIDADGNVEKFCKLAQPDGPGSQPYGRIGPQSKVTVKWESSPARPSSVKRWRVEVIPEREEYAPEDVAGIDLPEVTAAGSRHRASVPLDIDLESMPVRSVQIRIAALDDNGVEIGKADGAVIEALSTAFWLTEEQHTPPQTRQKRETVSTFAFARLRVATETTADAIDAAPGQWMEKDLSYYAVTFNRNQTSRVALSPVLRELEQRALENPEEGGYYTAALQDEDRLDVHKHICAPGLGDLADTDEGRKFLARRRQIFKLILEQKPAGWIETVKWSTDLSKRTRAYADAYRKLLSGVKDAADAAQILRIDTLYLRLKRANNWEPSVLVLPTHPLRLLWYAAYCDLLGLWTDELLQIPRNRRRMVDLDLLKRVAPLNSPPFAATEDGQVFLFAQNLRFFWGVCLPVEARDVGRRIAEVARIVGLQEDESALADLPPLRLANELRIYREIHPYLDTLRLNLINPGSGAFVAAALRSFLSMITDVTEDDEPVRLPRIEAVAHMPEPIPLHLPSLEQVQQEFYETQPGGRRHHLAPLFDLALRPLTGSLELPSGDTNLTVAIDSLSPEIRNMPQFDVEDSASFYGLLPRFLPQFSATEAGGHWQHHISFPEDATRERHPVTGPYTDELVDTHRGILRCIAHLAPGGNQDLHPGIVVEFSPEDRIRVDKAHYRSDWVITLDRFFGVEFFDDPSDPNLAGVAKRYLLDYAPEFLEGIGHRMLVTTSHREEIEEILGRAMSEMGFGMVEESVGEVLNHLKKISGRLALRVLGDDSRAREAVSLGVVAAYLNVRGELENSILIPVDAHPELFGVQARKKTGSTRHERCDLLRIQFLRNRLAATFIEVKSRVSSPASEDLLERIVDQIDATQEVFRDLFFRRDPVRLDHVLQRSRLVTILRFYLRRAWRYGLISDKAQYAAMETAIGRLESGIPDLRVDRWGFVVNLRGKPQRKVRIRETEIVFLTARDLAEVGLTDTKPQRPVKEPTAPAPPQSPAPQHQPPARPPGGTVTEPQGAVPTEPKAPKEPAHPQIDPTTAQPQLPTETSVVLGHTIGDQAPATWTLSVRGSPHLFILGIPGQGKSWTVTRILCELARQNVPSLVFDFHGQFADPSGIYSKIASPLVCDAAKQLPFSPFEASSDREAGASFWQANAFAVAEIFQYVTGMGDIQRDVFYEALRDCYLEVGFDATGATGHQLPLLSDVQARLEEMQNDRGSRNVIPRCRPLLEFGLFQEGGTPQVDFQQMLKRGGIIDVHALHHETLQLAAGAFVLRKIYKDMFRWGETDRMRLVIVLDEAHRLAKDITLPKIMKEGRKFGLAIVVASQGLEDYHPDVVGNAGTKVVFRTNFPMSKKVAGFLRARKGTDLAGAIEQLPVGEAYVQTADMATCSRIRMSPPPDAS